MFISLLKTKNMAKKIVIIKFVLLISLFPCLFSKVRESTKYILDDFNVG